jgi:lipid A 3-O-deacylase
MTRRTIALATAATFLALPFARAEPLQDTANIFTFQVENDAVSTLKGTSDQYYTSGLRLGWTSGTNQVPSFLEDAGHAVWGDGVQRVSLDLSQSIFTPRNTQTPTPSPEDRPYAAILAVTGSLIHDTDLARSVFSLELGAIGPIAQGEEVQNGFHDLIGDTPNQGWSTQLRDEPIFELTPSRTWRVPLGEYQGVSFDALPSATVGVGNLRNYVQLGGVMRFGQGLNSDFGVARIQPGLSGTDAFTPTQPFVWYVFGGMDGQVVGTDITLNGNTFPGGPHVAVKWDVGELEAGAAIIYHGVRVTYSQTWQTQEFRTQKAGLFNFGSLAVSVRF